MKVFNPTFDVHAFRFIARDTYGTLSIELKNSFTNVVTEIEVDTIVYRNGYTYVTFNAIFEEGNKGLIKIVDEDDVIAYRGHYLATQQATQTYELSKNLYTYATR